MRDRLPLLALAFAMLLGGSLVALQRASARGDFAEPFSSYRSDEEGTRALYLLLEEAGLPVARRHLDMDRLDGETTYVLLGVEGDKPEKAEWVDAGPKSETLWDLLFERLSAAETAELLRAVESGASLVYAPTRDHPLIARLGLTFTPLETTPSRKLVPALPSALTRGVRTLQSRVSGHLKGDEAVPLLIDPSEEDAPVALLLRRGQGRIVVLASPTLATNAELSQDDVAAFWISLLEGLTPPGHHIEFDEHHHGFESERSVMAWGSQYGFGTLITQLLFVTALLVLALRRLGRAEEEAWETPGATADQLASMAGLYRRGKHRSHVATTLVRSLRLHLQRRLRLGREAPPGAVDEALQALGHGESAERLRSLEEWAKQPRLDEGALQEIARVAAEERTRFRSSTARPTAGTPAGPESKP